jgi:hypothetical protein
MKFRPKARFTDVMGNTLFVNADGLCDSGDWQKHNTLESRISVLLDANSRRFALRWLHLENFETCRFLTSIFINRALLNFRRVKILSFVLLPPKTEANSAIGVRSSTCLHTLKRIESD